MVLYTKDKQVPITENTVISIEVKYTNVKL